MTADYNENRIEAMISEIGPTEADAAEAVEMMEQGGNPFSPGMPPLEPPDEPEKREDMVEVCREVEDVHYGDDEGDAGGTNNGDDPAPEFDREIADSVYETACVEALGEMGVHSLRELRSRCEDEGYPEGFTPEAVKAAIEAAAE